MTMARILVVGLGMVGSAVRASGWMSRHQLIAASRRAPGVLKLDITDEPDVKSFFKRNGPFDAVINCAAEANVDACEKDPEAARKVNALGVRALAQSCVQTGAALLHLSTDYVFDGSASRPYAEDDAVGPCSIYGMTKLEGERYALEIPERSAVVRTTWIFGGTRADFVNGVIDRLKRGEVPGAVDERVQTSSPTYAPDLAEALGTVTEAFLLPARAAKRRANRVFHVVNRGATTRHAMAARIARALKRPQDLPRLAARDIPNWVAVRPLYSVLSTDRAERELGLRPRTWEEALDAYMKART